MGCSDGKKIREPFSKNVATESGVIPPAAVFVSQDTILTADTNLFDCSFFMHYALGGANNHYETHDRLMQVVPQMIKLSGDGTVVICFDIPATAPSVRAIVRKARAKDIDYFTPDVLRLWGDAVYFNDAQFSTFYRHYGESVTVDVEGVQRHVKWEDHIDVDASIPHGEMVRMHSSRLWKQYLKQFRTLPRAREVMQHFLLESFLQWANKDPQINNPVILWGARFSKTTSRIPPTSSRFKPSPGDICNITFLPNLGASERLFFNPAQMVLKNGTLPSTQTVDGIPCINPSEGEIALAYYLSHVNRSHNVIVYGNDMDIVIMLVALYAYSTSPRWLNDRACGWHGAGGAFISAPERGWTKVHRGVHRIEDETLVELWDIELVFRHMVHWGEQEAFFEKKEASVRLYIYLLWTVCRTDYNNGVNRVTAEKVFRHYDTYLKFLIRIDEEDLEERIERHALAYVLMHIFNGMFPAKPKTYEALMVMKARGTTKPHEDVYIYVLMMIKALTGADRDIGTPVMRNQIWKEIERATPRNKNLPWPTKTMGVHHGRRVEWCMLYYLLAPIKHGSFPDPLMRDNMGPVWGYTDDPDGGAQLA